MDEINGSQLILMFFFFLKLVWIVMQDACVCVQVQSVQTLTLILYTTCIIHISTDLNFSCFLGWTECL